MQVIQAQSTSETRILSTLLFLQVALIHGTESCSVFFKAVYSAATNHLLRIPPKQDALRRFLSELPRKVIPGLHSTAFNHLCPRISWSASLPRICNGFQQDQVTIIGTTMMKRCRSNPVGSVEPSLNILNTSVINWTLERQIFSLAFQKNPIKFHETGDILVSARSADPFISCI